MMRTILAIGLALGGVASASPAAAQYYPPPAYPPPGYAPPPGYYRPPPPPPYYAAPPIGGRCEAYLPTPYGPRRLICRIVDPKPVGRPCACPPPPGYPPEPFIRGQTIR